MQDEGVSGEDAIHGDTDCKEQSKDGTTDDGPTSAHESWVWSKYKGEVLQKASIGAGRSLRERSERRVERHGGLLGGGNCETPSRCKGQWDSMAAREVA